MTIGAGGKAGPGRGNGLGTAPLDAQPTLRLAEASVETSSNQESEVEAATIEATDLDGHQSRT
jgi:hypothetical protein